MTAAETQNSPRPRCAVTAVMTVAWLLAILAPRAATADEVYGCVRLGDEMAGKRTLELQGGGPPGGKIQVRTDQHGNYRVFLEPGRYEARLIAEENTEPQVVHTLPAPVQLDLNFPRNR